MEEVFNKDYSFFYDIFYKNKNYRKECLLLEGIFKKFLFKKPRLIVDIACGTGGHANILATMGYDVIGIDASEHMLKRAKEKADKLSVRVKYYKQRMENLNLRNKPDVIISMFSAINYITEERLLIRFLKKISNTLKKNGLFIFDFWNGHVVPMYYCPKKIQFYRDGKYLLRRESSTKLDLLNKLAVVSYRCNYIKGKKSLINFREKHILKYFLPQEIEELLKRCGFRLIKIAPFLKISNPIRKNTWDLVCIAKRSH